MQNYLRRVHFAHDGYAEVITLPRYRVAEVTIDARHAFGRPRFARGGGKIEDAIDLFRAGEPVDVVAEEYGLTRDESAKLGWAVLMKDKRIRYRQAEIDAVIGHQARCFVITRGDLTSAAYAERFVTNQQAIFAPSSSPGPFIYAVHTDRLERLYPPHH